MQKFVWKNNFQLRFILKTVSFKFASFKLNKIKL